MIKQVPLLSLVVLFMPSFTLAQHNCPQGFQYVGNLSRTGSFGNELNEKREINLPENATIDQSYQQTRIRSQNGNPRAHSDLLPKDIPKGIHIITYGSTDLEKGWAVSAPELTKVIINSQSGESDIRYRFRMKLYCTTGASETTRHSGTCDVTVEVCYLPKKTER
jgi:hypothetical protein